MSDDDGLRCDACGWLGLADDRFCESCGAPLTPGVVVDSDDHREIDDGTVGGVTDRGLVHRRNEDAMQIARVGDSVVAIVCDGVSSSAAAADASSAAAEAGIASLTANLADPGADRVAGMRDAMTTALDAVVRVPFTRTRKHDSPACTFLGAAWDGHELTLGSAGDCRGYWVSPAAVVQLTVDDSWVQEQVDLGALPAAEAEQHPYAHRITRWLGDDAPGGPPRVTTFSPPSAGRLVLCSDGMWNYASTTERVAELVRSHPADTPPIDVARALTRVALAAGGRDNITVVVVDIDVDHDAVRASGNGHGEGS
jgi:serine/threonine protein phosphatase PrpC